MSRGLTGPRSTLNELRWRHDALEEAVIHYVHRGAPGDRAILRGEDITELGRSFITVVRDGEESMIPYHRVFRIDRAEEVIWERRGHEGQA